MSNTFEMSQCEESDSQEGPWSSIEGGHSTKRWVRIKPDEWEKWCRQELHDQPMPAPAPDLTLNGVPLYFDKLLS